MVKPDREVIYCASHDHDIIPSFYPIRSERKLLISVPYTTHKRWWHTQIYLQVQLKNFKLTCAKALINSIHCGWDSGSDFNKYVDATAEELEKWLKREQSQQSGWTKGNGSGESIGHESGREIIQILTKNSQQEPSKYDKDDVARMRRVVAYCKRHLAQEEKAKQNTNSKSYKSLKNRGYDALKAR